MRTQNDYPIAEEGDPCPECEGGVLIYGPVRNCTCHLGHPPCGNCVDNPLICDLCDYEHED